MKNSMLKGAHLSESKSRDILRFFSEDLTATQIASITGVSRVTVNNYFRTIRMRIAHHCEEKNPSSHYSQSQSVVYLKKNFSDYEHHAVNYDHSLYGFHWHNGKVFTSTLEKKAKQDTEAPKPIDHESMIDHYRQQNFHAVADFKNWKLVNVQKSDGAENDIFCFWNDAKSRILKFRGLHKRMLYLHVKECEFRYNYRNNDINDLLSGIMQKHFLIY